MENEIDPGVIEKFLEELPEKAFHLGLRVVQKNTKKDAWKE